MIIELAQSELVVELSLHGGVEIIDAAQSDLVTELGLLASVDIGQETVRFNWDSDRVTRVRRENVTYLGEVVTYQGEPVWLLVAYEE